MKYHLDTIPVWDAFLEEKECPFCILEDNLEKSYVDSFLGGSVMEPDTRIEVNAKGFCPHHNQLLYKAQNRLGLALMTHTHTLETLKRFRKATDRLKKGAFSRGTGFSAASLFRRTATGEKGHNSPMAEFSEWLESYRNSCVICDRMDYSMKRYVYTMLHLWENDSEFKDVMAKSKGFCLYHLKAIIDMAVESLNAKKQQELLEMLIPMEIKNLERLEQELLWFTQKFDYRNQDKPWGNSKDSLPRLLQKLTGKYMENNRS
jgi:hypothetical protein